MELILSQALPRNPVGAVADYQVNGRIIKLRQQVKGVGVVDPVQFQHTSSAAPVSIPRLAWLRIPYATRSSRAAAAVRDRASSMSAGVMWRWVTNANGLLAWVGYLDAVAVEGGDHFRGGA